jgi:hypothetical protein
MNDDEVTISILLLIVLASFFSIFLLVMQII